MAQPKKRKRKHDPKRYDCVFIGYAHNNFAFRFFVLKSENEIMESNTLVESKNVDFFENNLPFKSRMEK